MITAEDIADLVYEIEYGNSPYMLMCKVENQDLKQIVTYKLDESGEYWFILEDNTKIKFSKLFLKCLVAYKKVNLIKSIVK